MRGGTNNGLMTYCLVNLTASVCGVCKKKNRGSNLKCLNKVRTWFYTRVTTALMTYRLDSLSLCAKVNTSHPIVCVGRFDTVRCRANTSLSRHVFTATAARANLLFQIGPCHACPHIAFIENLSTLAVDTSDMSLWQTTQHTHGSAALTIDNTFN